MKISKDQYEAMLECLDLLTKSSTTTDDIYEQASCILKMFGITVKTPSILDDDWILADNGKSIFRKDDNGMALIYVYTGEYADAIAALPDLIRALKMVRDKTMVNSTIPLDLEDCQLIDIALNKAHIE